MAQQTITEYARRSLHYTVADTINGVLLDGEPEGEHPTEEHMVRVLAPNLDPAREALRSDEFVDAPSTTVHLNVAAVAEPLLMARGWRVVRNQDGTFHSVTSPDGRRHWHLDEALTIALTAEAHEVCS